LAAVDDRRRVVGGVQLFDARLSALPIAPTNAADASRRWNGDRRTLRKSTRNGTAGSGNRSVDHVQFGQKCG
jgi:hypothetical protein